MKQVMGCLALAFALLFPMQAHANWSAGAGLEHARYQHTATLLADGRLLVVGGSGVTHSSATAEVSNPSASASRPAPLFGSVSNNIHPGGDGHDHRNRVSGHR